MKQNVLIIIPVYNNSEHITGIIPLLDDIRNGSENHDYGILIIDDGSSDDIIENIASFKWIKYIQHKTRLGYGSSLLDGFQYARDMGYDIAITLDPLDSGIANDIDTLLKNINYGYDVVSCSRILENFDHEQFSNDIIASTTTLSESLEDITENQITDPLSEIKAYRVSSLENFELNDDTHGILLQIWVQSYYFGFEVIEIPAASGETFGKELISQEDPLGLYLSLMETEKHLYNKGSIN